MIPNNVELRPMKFRNVIYDKYLVSRDGHIYNVRLNKEMVPFDSGRGYKMVTIYDNGKKINGTVHHIVYETFSGNNPNDYSKEIDHINMDKSDNRFENLDMVTRKENVRRAFKRGIRKPFRKSIPDEAAIEICELLASGLKPYEVINQTGYSPGWVRGIYNGDYCIEIAKNYTWDEDPRRGVSIPDSVIHDICKDLAEGKMGIREIARKYDVGHTTVAGLRDGRFRTDITSQYDMSGLSDAEKLSLQTGEHVVPYVTRDREPTNVLVTNLGRFFREGSLKELSPSMQHNDLCVVIRIADGKKRPIPCKKLVAEMFCDNPKGYKDIIYKDGNIYNLKSTNLKFVSHSKACKASEGYELRRSYDGSENPNAKISEDDAEAILIMHYEMQMSCKAIARCFNLTKKAIEKICNGEVRGKLYNKYMRTHLNMQKNYLGSDNLVIKL